jgi:hypothetical protein
MEESSGRDRGYWATQITVCAVFAVSGIVGGPFVMVYSDDPGYGLIFFLGGVLFLVCLIWLIRQIVGKTKQQKAIYAWAIMQQQSIRPTGDAAVASDMVAMLTASRARDGKSSRAELERLQALRPDVPYPGTLPSGPSLPGGGHATFS